jgi:anthranilate synthase/aminodeoxychorismate synthase-like glutamine amidotransferase
VQLIGAAGEDFRVVRNDAISVAGIRSMAPEGILISPGPGRPEDAGICVETILELGPTIPILGVCLGHQAIGLAYGGTITRAPELMHGKSSEVHHDGSNIYTSLTSPFDAGRYHSLVIAPESIPSSLRIVSQTSGGVIMGVRHKSNPVEGIQFHPESILTPQGPALIANWLNSLKEIR